MIELLLLAVEDNRDRMLPLNDHAAEIAAALDARVVLFRVYPEAEFEERRAEFGFESTDPTTLAKRHAVTRECAATLRERGVSFSIEATIGDPATEIERYVNEHDIDHVFLGGRRRSATGKAILGSVSQSVLVSVDVPCTVLMG